MIKPLPAQIPGKYYLQAVGELVYITNKTSFFTFDIYQGWSTATSKLPSL
jgi:hypothetical protein